MLRIYHDVATVKTFEDRVDIVIAKATNDRLRRILPSY